MAAGGIIIAAAAGAAHKQTIESANAAWSPYAKAKGLNFRAGRIEDQTLDESRIDGTVDGVSIAFQTALIAHNWGVMAIAVPLSPLTLNLEITREGLFGKIAKVFGAKDLVLGDEAFDKAYLVSTSDESARELLTAATRAEMLSLDVATLAYADGTLEGQKAKIALGIPRLLATTEDVDRLVNLLVALAKVKPA